MFKNSLIHLAESIHTSAKNECLKNTYDKTTSARCVVLLSIFVLCIVMNAGNALERFGIGGPKEIASALVRMHEMQKEFGICIGDAISQKKCSNITRRKSFVLRNMVASI